MDTFPTDWISNYSFNGTETSFLGGKENGKEFKLEETIATSLALGIIILITIIGNTLVLLAVFLNSHLRSTTNYFIVNLAFADLFLGTTVLPFSATLETLHYWPFGYIICDLWAAADVLWCTASIMTLCVISIDRYIGVTRPLQHSSIINEKRALCMIILVWILSMVISIAPLIGWRESKGPDPRKCTVTQQIGYVIFSVSGSFYIPMFIIIIVYIRIYREASRHSRYLNRGSDTDTDKLVNGVALRIHTGRTSKTSCVPQYNSDKDKSTGSRSRTRQSVAEKIAKFKKEKKAAKTLGIVVGVFILCWFPFFFCLPLAAFKLYAYLLTIKNSP
ncbi:hypothetical protein CHS0354_014402 [Potamilus streckersoni]|uniref:G-protein coupled receptors family 1 profile domain-containing protein n=1 Tax=Potamilus streckersoni TaxID=2493646 RepID=A0AAE0SI59_9BIVA|nr:hypothetical protein CHS0354_014402 [Potamilus streckersoni]